MDKNIDVIWRYLSIVDLLKLIQTNTYFKTIGNNRSTWVFLLKRDFGITHHGNNPKLNYIINYTTHNFIDKHSVYLIYFDQYVFDSIYAKSSADVYDKYAAFYNTGKLSKTNSVYDVIKDYLADYLDSLSVNDNYQLTGNDIKQLFSFANLRIEPIKPLF